MQYYKEIVCKSQPYVINTISVQRLTILKIKKRLNKVVINLWYVK